MSVDPATGAQSTLSVGGALGGSMFPEQFAEDAYGQVVAVVFSFTLPFMGLVVHSDPATGIQDVISTGGIFERPVDLAIVLMPAP